MMMLIFSKQLHRAQWPGCNTKWHVRPMVLRSSWVWYILNKIPKRKIFDQVIARDIPPKGRSMIPKTNVPTEGSLDISTHVLEKNEKQLPRDFSTCSKNKAVSPNPSLSIHLCISVRYMAWCIRHVRGFYITKLWDWSRDMIAILNGPFIGKCDANDTIENLNSTHTAIQTVAFFVSRRHYS